MKNTLKSEFRKLFTLRSTYLVTLIGILLVLLLAGYGEGYKNGSSATSLTLNNSLIVIANFASLFAVIVAILAIAHEYRYNTVINTLVNSNSRTKVLFSKIIAVITYCILLTFILCATALGSISLGANLAGHPLPNQEIDYLLFMAKAAFFVTGTALFGMLFATLIRNVVAAFAIFFILPNAIETIANLLIKEKSVYMPFSALNEVVVTVPPDLTGTPFVYGDLSPLQGALIFLAYLIPLWIIAWLIFLRRDAT